MPLLIPRQQLDGHCPEVRLNMIRVSVYQPLVPKYRLPFFAGIAAEPDIALTVYAGGTQGSLAGASSSDTFRMFAAPLRTLRLGPVETRWQLQQMRHSMREVDVCVLSWDIHYPLLLPAIARAHFHGAKVLLWGHGYSKHGSGLRDRIRNAVGRRADAVMLYTRSVAKRLDDSGVLKGKPVFVAQNALDQSPISEAADAWRARPDELHNVRAQHRINPEQTVIFVSRLEADNNVEVMLDAVALARSEYPEIKLVIVGGGDHKATLERYSRDAGIEEQVIFTGPIYDEHELAPWMLSATLFTYPQNIGLSVHHAFGYGLPVVTGNNISTHNPEIELIKNGENGVLFEDGSAAALADTWKRLFADPEYVTKMSSAAIATVRDEYSMTNMVAGFCEAVRALGGKPA